MHGRIIIDRGFDGSIRRIGAIHDRITADRGFRGSIRGIRAIRDPKTIRNDLVEILRSDPILSDPIAYNPRSDRKPG